MTMTIDHGEVHESMLGLRITGSERAGYSIYVQAGYDQRCISIKDHDIAIAFFTNVLAARIHSTPEQFASYQNDQERLAKRFEHEDKRREWGR